MRKRTRPDLQAVEEPGDVGESHPAVAIHVGFVLAIMVRARGETVGVLDQSSTEPGRSSGSADPWGWYGHPSIITHRAPVAISTH